MASKIMILLFMHLFADFLLQGSTFSKLKMSKIGFLLLHVLIYTTFFILLSPLILSLSFQEGLVFSGINGGLHLGIDFITSKLKKIFWEKKEGVYVAIITVDNILHLTILIYSYITLFPEAAAKIIGM